LQIDVQLCERDLVYITTSAVPAQDGITSTEFKRQEVSFTQLIFFPENRSCTAENSWIVYRGKTMFHNQLETSLKNNCGDLLSFASFLTADLDKEVAIDFISWLILM